MSTSTYVALSDLFVSPGVRAYRAGQTVNPSNTAFDTWKAEGKVATEASKAAKAVTSTPSE